MFREALQYPQVYALSQWLWYRPGQQRRYVREWIRPRPGDHILDIGCGPARVLDWLTDVDYVGYDPSPRYIADAVRRYGSRGHFHSGYLGKIGEEEKQRFDIVLASGVLHHIPDGEAQALLAMAAQALKSGGRMIT